MAVRREVQKRGAKSALSLFKEKLGNVKNRRAPVVRNNNQVGPTRTAKQKKDAIIDGDFTDITPKKGFTKKQLAALITGGSIVTLGALNAMSPAKLEEVAADADADTKPKKGKGETAAEKAARLKKLREDQAKVNASNPGSPGNKVTTKTKATTTTAGKGKGKLFKKFRPFGGVIARALLGDDEKFGGERGMIDFIRTKKKKKPVKKNMGGMMKKKGYADGGAMKKKGYAMGGMAKKGYANGGPAKKTTAKKTSSRGKARGVGAATRGYGATMR